MLRVRCLEDGRKFGRCRPARMSPVEWMLAEGTRSIKRWRAGASSESGVPAGTACGAIPSRPACMVWDLTPATALHALWNLRPAGKTLGKTRPAYMPSIELGGWGTNDMHKAIPR